MRSCLLSFASYSVSASFLCLVCCCSSGFYCKSRSGSCTSFPYMVCLDTVAKRCGVLTTQMCSVFSPTEHKY